jgi:hypothetical protein
MGRRRTPVFQALDDQLISSGLQPDRHTLKKLLWESAANVAFWNGTVRRKVPAALAFDTTAEPIRGLAQQQASDGSRWLWTGVSDDIYRWRFGAPEFIGHLGTYRANATATARPTLYDFTPYGDWMLVNGGEPAEPAKIYKPGAPAIFGAFAPGQAPVGVVQFLKYMSFVMALGYGPRGTQVGWSDANNIELWNAAADNTAGSMTIDEFNTPIRAGARLGDSLAVYAEDQMALVRYVGLPFIFGQKTVIDGIGAVGKQAVASDLRQNVGVSRAGVWATDGVTAKYIDEGFLSTYLQDNVNWLQAAKIVAMRNDHTGCFEFHFPMGVSFDINEAWSWDPRTGGWSPCPPKSAVDERRLFDHVLYGTNAGSVQLGDYDLNADAPLSLVTKPLVMSTAESPHVVTRVDEVDLLLHQASNIEWRIGSCDEPNGDWEWTEFEEATAGAKVYEVAELPEQPYWKLELRSTPDVDNWNLDLQGFLLYGVTTGSKM